MLKRFAGAVAASLVIGACAESPVAPTGSAPDKPALAVGGGGAWVEMVTGGGKNIRAANPSIIEWIGVSVQRSASGQLSGSYEYANLGIQGWRYRGEPDCLAISEDGKSAVVIGPVTNAQSREAVPIELGKRVGFKITDDGSGSDTDQAFAFFAGTLSCEETLADFGSGPAVTLGNYSIFRR